MKQEITAYEWLYKIIESCNNSFHFESCDLLIQLFEKKYPDEESMLLDLQKLRQTKWMAVHNLLP